MANNRVNSYHGWMELAIREAYSSKMDERHEAPMVGTVAVMNDELMATAHRGEIGHREHAEFTLLEHKLGGVSLVGATVFTTLEPCTSRNSQKLPCTERLIARRVGKVVIGMLDPSPYLTGKGVLALQHAGIAMEMFPPDLAEEVRRMNAPFIDRSAREAPPPKVRISGYEWDLLEDRGDVAGRTKEGWYEYFLATNDLANMARLREFYTPPPERVLDINEFVLELAQKPEIILPTDLRLLQAVTADPKQLLSLTPREFEEFTAELLERLGYHDVKIGKGSKDGGVDVSAFIEHALGLEKVIVQCKRHAVDHKVGEPLMKQLLADTSIHKAARGLMVTTSCLTRSAKLLVDSFYYRLGALDHDELCRLLRDEPPKK